MMNNVRVTPIKVVRRKGDDCIIDEADDDYDDYDLRGKTRRGYEIIASSSCGSPRRCLQLNTKSGEGSSETLSEEDGSSEERKTTRTPGRDDPARTKQQQQNIHQGKEEEEEEEEEQQQQQQQQRERQREQQQQHDHHAKIKNNVLERMGRCSSTSSMISSTAKTDDYRLHCKPLTAARVDGYCYDFLVDERKEKAYAKARKQLLKQKERANESYARYSKARKAWKEAKKNTTHHGATNTISALNDAVNQCQREVAKNGVPESKRAKAWLNSLSVKSKRGNCEKTYEDYSQMSERERFDRERASVRVDLINVFPDHPRYSLGAIDSMKEREELEEEEKVQHELITESLNRVISSNSAYQSSMSRSENESSSGGETYSNSNSPGFSYKQNQSQANDSWSLVESPRSSTGLRGFRKEEKEDPERTTCSSENICASNVTDCTEEEPQNAIMQLLSGSFFEKLNMFPARISSMKENEGKKETKRASYDDEEEEEDDEEQFRLPEDYMNPTSSQYFGKMERVLMAFSARSPRDLEKSHVVAAAISLLVFEGDEENAFWTLVCLAEDVNLFLDEAEVTTETIVLEERTRHNSSFELVNTNLVGKIFTRLGAGFFPPNVVLRILDAIILSPPPLSSRLLHHIAYEFLFHHGEKLKDEKTTLEVASDAYDCNDLIFNGMKMMSATETMKSNSSLRILARQRVERSSGGFCGPDKGWSVSLVSAKRMKNGEVSAKKQKVFVPTSGWSSDEDDLIRKTTRSCDFFGQFSPLRNSRKSQDDLLREEEKKHRSQSVQGFVNEIDESHEEAKGNKDPMTITLSPVKTIPSQVALDESANIMRYKFVIRGPNDVTCTMYRNRADLVHLHEILCERKITAQLSMLKLPKSFTNKLTAGITKTGFNESQEYFVRLSKAGVPGLQKVFEEFFELDSPDLHEYCYESDDTQGSFDDY